MRSLTRQLLEEHGYQVLEADDGKKALDVLAGREDSVDLMLTDVVMRGMGGPELALRVMDKHPNMKVVYMSGFTGELTSQSGALQAGIALLEKPFTRATLLRSIGNALG